VIARPFTGKPGSFQRTDQRRDFSIAPPGGTLLDQIQSIGAAVVAIGKVDDIFCRKGITHIEHTRNNTQAIDAILKHLTNGIDRGLIFANLGDFDTLYGHRRDPRGFALSLEQFDEALPRILGALREEDVLIITADHGCDPTWPYHTDHTREEVPVLISGKRIRLEYSLGVRDSLSDISATILEAFGIAQAKSGKSFWKEVKRT
jgi:phosphopentomutase